MADIRINALATTAASTASDDFVAVDGSANGTRKLNAYSPTFGGNLTLSGATSTITLGSTNTGSIAVDANGALIVTPKAGQYTTLSVSGNSGLFVNNGTTQIYLGNSGGNAVAGTLNANDFLLIRDGSVKLTATATGVDIYGNLTVNGTGFSSFGGPVQVSNTLAAKETNASLTLQPGPGTGGINYAFGQGTGDHVWYGGTTERMRLGYGGNLLIGTTTDGGQKLQVAGTGFFKPSGAGSLSIETGTTNSDSIRLQGGGTTNTWMEMRGYLGVKLIVDATTALTLDSSQRANFAGGIKISGNHSDFNSSSTFILGRVAGEPILMFSISSAAANERFYDFTATSTQFAMRLVNDAYSAATNFITVDRTGTTVDSVAIGGPLKLNNAYVAGAPTATGYVTIQDSAGNTYKVLVGT